MNKDGMSNSYTLREARIQTLEPDNWMFEVEKYGHATRKIIPLSIKDRLEELICSALRTRDGVTRNRWEQISPIDNLGSIYDQITSCDKCRELIKDGLIIVNDRHIKATPHGILILDSVIPHLLHELGIICQQEEIT
ncbi:radical S-adenosyl methionine domain-containing protein 1 [Mactra antiquata]